MSDLVKHYDIAPAELKRGKRLKRAAWTAPVALGTVPAIVFLVLSLLASSTPVFAVSFFVLGVVLTIVGFVIGLLVSGVLAYRYKNWSSDMRERIAANGIRAEEIDWFRNELRSSEKRALKALENADELLADAYREMLASRLTASRIVRSSKRELQATKRRRLKLKQVRSDSARTFNEDIDRDFANISNIQLQATQMLAESESRLQMIEAAAARGSTLAGHELALKKLAMRTAELPAALKDARQTQEIKLEVERELNEKGQEKILPGETDNVGEREPQ